MSTTKTKSRPKSRKATNDRATTSSKPKRGKKAPPLELEADRKKAKRSKSEKAKKAAKPKKAKKVAVSAKTADRHQLYQWAVQSPEEDVKFLSRVYKKKRKKTALHFREDFCGTALLTAEWIRRGKKYTGEGFDICPDTIGWGVDNIFDDLGDDAERATLHVKDVREPSLVKPDVRAAQNFSYFVFKERAELMDYLRAAYEDLADDGVFVMDIYGGPDSMMEMEEVRDIEEGFTYVWDQVAYWPATGEYKAHIHFRFEDGSQMKRAFTYDWRLWSLTEIRDALLEAGFPEVESFWEGTDEDGESGNGIYRRSKRGENCEAWVTYLVAYK